MTPKILGLQIVVPPGLSVDMDRMSSAMRRLETTLVDQTLRKVDS